MSCVQIAVCVAHRFRKMAVSSIWKRNQREVCFGSFPEAGFFCYTELLKSILPPFPTLRAFEHCVLPGVWTLRHFRMLCEHMRTEQEKENGISEYFV